MKKLSWWLALFFIFNLLFLTRLPIFNDEAIYIHWGQQIIANPYRWWFPLRLDGKQPFYMVVLGWVTNVSPLGILFSARLVSLYFSCLAFWASAKIFDLLFPQKNKRPFYFLMTTSCYLLFFNRMALMEPAIIGLWYLGIYLFLLMLKKPNWQKGVVLGLILGLGWWIKTSMALIFPVLLFSFLIEFYFSSLEKKQRPKIWHFCLSLLFFIALTLPLLLSCHFKHLLIQEKKWLFSWQEVLRFPFDYWIKNLGKGMVWLIAYLTPLPFLFFLTGVLGFKRKEFKKLFFVLGWIFIPFFLQIIVARNYSSRYLVVIVPAILIFSSLGWQRIKNSFLKKLIVVVTLVPSLVLSFSPSSFFRLMPNLTALQADKRQYINGWPSGYGIDQAVRFLEKQARLSPIAVFVRHDYGNPEDAMFCLLRKNKNIVVSYLKSPFLEKIKELEEQGVKFYFVSRGKQYGDWKKNLKEVIKFPKPAGDEFVGIYQFTALSPIPSLNK